MEPMPAGYSGTPLVTKLGVVAGQRLIVIDEPSGFRGLLEPLPHGVRISTSLRGKAAVVVLFVMAQSALERRIGAAERRSFRTVGAGSRGRSEHPGSPPT